VYSPLSANRTPVKGIGLIAALDNNKENERPTVVTSPSVSVVESHSRKTKHEGSSSSMGIKAKRLKKLTDQLPDIGGLEGNLHSICIVVVLTLCKDIMKMQQELTEQQNKAKSLEEMISTLQKQADEERKGM
jgi:hypothetical protein